MGIFGRKGRTRLMAVGGGSLFFMLMAHTFNFANPFAIPGQLSASINIISHCATTNFGFLDDTYSHPPHQIPKVVHQIWKSNDLQGYSTRIKASYDSWNDALVPLNYTIKLWTDDAILELISNRYAWLLSTYEGYPQNIQRADMARLLIIHAEGGIYADLDVFPTSIASIQCAQSLNLEAIFAPTAGTQGLSNHFFMAARGSPFIQWALWEGKRRAHSMYRLIPLPYIQVFWSTGPTMITTAFRNYAWIYNALGPKVGLLGIEYTRELVRHEAGRSWQGSDGQALNYIADHARPYNLILVILFLFTMLGIVFLLRYYL